MWFTGMYFFPFFFIPFVILFVALRFGRSFFGRRNGRDDRDLPFSRRRPLEYEQYFEGGDARTRKLESRIFKLAYRLRGRITVSDIVVDTGVSVQEAEEVVQGMVDNVRVKMEVDDRGFVVYEFPEIISRFQDDT